MRRRQHKTRYNLYIYLNENTKLKQQHKNMEEIIITSPTGDGNGKKWYSSKTSYTHIKNINENNSTETITRHKTNATKWHEPFLVFFSTGRG